MATSSRSGSTSEAAVAWLLKDGDVLATLEVADDPGDRVKGLAGRPEPEGALLLRRPLLLHTIGVNFGVDVAFCNPEMEVTEIARLGRGRIALPRLSRGGRMVVVASECAFERWRLAVGDQLEVKGT
jgi:uncharacterized membrane protein (UPF0127 family)